MACLDDDTLAALADESLAQPARGAALAHLEGCATCRQVVAMLARAPAASVKAGDEIGDYVILDRAGIGSSATVWAAWDRRLDRKVALKFLTNQTDPQAEAQFRDEAKAMARLSHPHVVAIYDVSSWHGRLFFAMQFVEGATLGAWLKTPRTVAQKLAVLLEAGEGLAAAHQAGLVHRDLKPDNVLVDSSGSAQVTDFGLSRARPSVAAPAATSLGHSAFGGLVGTPLYMAPEQLRGEAADFRSDQFSFCVTLYEALVGERPFSGDSVAALEQAILARPAEVPASARLPAPLVRVMKRGLSARPEDRFPSMQALLAALRDDPRARRRRILGAAALSLLVPIAAVAAWAWADAQTRVCRGAETKLQGVWDEARAAAAQRAFVATGRPYAAETFARVKARLDLYAAAWVAARTDACEATRLRGEQSEHLMDLRVACLDRRRTGLAALTTVFASADAQTVEQAAVAASSLDGLEGCADLATLESATPLPTDPARRREVERLQEQLAQVKAIFDSGGYERVLPLATGLAREAEATGHRPLEAETLYRLGVTQLRTSVADADQTFIAAERAAEAGRTDALLVAIRVSRIHVFGRLNQLERASEAIVSARAALERIGSPASPLADLENAEGGIRHRQGRFDEANAHFTRAVKLLMAEPNHDVPRTVVALNNLGKAQRGQGDFKGAEQSRLTALGLAEGAFGPNHPLVGAVLEGLAIAQGEQGRLDETLLNLRRALDIAEHAYGTSAEVVGNLQLNIADTLRRQGQPQDAMAMTLRAREIFIATLGPDNPSVANTHHVVGLALMDLGRFAEARTELEAALALRQRALNERHPAIADSLNALAENAQRSGDAKAALGFAQRAVSLLDVAKPGSAVALATALLRRGEARLALDDTAGAHGDAERSVALLATTHDAATLERARGLAAASAQRP